MIYYEIRNLYEVHYPRDTLIQFLQSHQDLLYFGILHNKDTFPNGELKKPHYHLIIGIEKDSKFAKSYLSSLFDDEALYFQNVRSLPHYIRYLTHKDNLEKYQYNDSEIFTNDLNLYEELSTKQITISKTDTLLDEFYHYILFYPFYKDTLERDIFIWFRDKKKLDYYVRNRYNILMLIKSIKPYLVADSTFTEVK